MLVSQCCLRPVQLASASSRPIPATGGKIYPQQTAPCRSSSTSAPLPGCRAAAVEDPPASTESYTWQGTDEYSDLEDRKDAPPLSLPQLKAPRRVVLVRHGQSTWNAEGRIQGSCNASKLTEKGQSQAETTGDLVRLDPDSSLKPAAVCCPLQPSPLNSRDMSDNHVVLCPPCI